MTIASEAKPKVAKYFAFFAEGKPQSADPMLAVFDEIFSKDFKINTGPGGEKNFDEWRAAAKEMMEKGMKIEVTELEEDGEKGLKCSATRTVPGGEPKPSIASATLDDAGKIAYIKPV
uniref:SnoaL-like domain-containing protein n=1 Tax=Amphora coffeiformis TaxID=265554 RepID=A0A7S3P873_9STRA|mmetsp:Transcript_9679/g.18509  ORF Transcript_9679/g.18509 Transcript_9679/m.18509 type:complete len:118 (+) Transcript_9679:83-436(+)|eukprot:scaffold2519_cov168-Amphora_coffeaeformis.AAC.13